MLSYVSHFNSVSVKNVCGGRSEKKPQNKAITDQKLHVSDLLPLAAIPWVKGHPSTMWLDQGANRPRFSVF